MVVPQPVVLERLVPELQDAPVLGVDTETTGLDPLTSAAPPPAGDDRSGDRGGYGTIPVPDTDGVVCPGTRWLVHNGRFDVRFVMAAGLRWSGRLFDTMLASQLLGAGTPEGNLGQSGLGAVAERYLGLHYPRSSNTAAGKEH